MMDPVIVRRTAAERADSAIGPRSRKPKSSIARVRYPPVVVCTGLPPLVDGQIRCFLRLTIRRLRIVQSDLSEQADLIVRAKWWGEPSDGAYFKPIFGRKKSGRQITARYAVRCGPKQFSAYLMDAGALTLELLPEGSNDRVLGIANISDIVNLSLQKPILSWYKILAVGNHRHVADVHVNISFAELQDVYGESSGTGTGTEMSQDESDETNSPAPPPGRTYRVESNFNENIGSKAARLQEMIDSDSNSRTKLNPSVASEVDRLIERAELLKMLVSPDPGRNYTIPQSAPPPSLRPNSNIEFDADNSDLLSDTSLLAELFYSRTKNGLSTNKVDSSVQVTPKQVQRKPPVSPVPENPTVATRSPGKSPLRLDIRRVTSPKTVKFFDAVEPKNPVSHRKTITEQLISQLKRVEGAIIHVHALRLSPGDYRHFIAGSIPRRSLPAASPGLSKPPRPLKLTFFVNAQLPTGEMCQLSRICGKADLETNLIDFEQAEVVPLALSDKKIELWLESAAITFRVSCRHASLNRTQPVGVAVFSLEPLLFSENFKSRQHVALSTRFPGSTMEISVDLQIAPLSEHEKAEFFQEERQEYQQERQRMSFERRIDSSSAPMPTAEKVFTPEPQLPPPSMPLVVMFCVSDVEFIDSFVTRMTGAHSIASKEDSSLSNRWEVFLTAAAFSQPRRSSSRRHVVMSKEEKRPVHFAPKLQLFYVYTLDPATTSRFEDNHLVVELKRHVGGEEEDQLLGICKVSLHQLFLAFGCDPIATAAVLRAPGPVISVSHEFLPADDPFTLASVARLRCTLVAGSPDQIAHFNSLMSQTDLIPARDQQPKKSKSEKVQPSEKREKVSHQSPPNRLQIAITELDQLYIPIESSNSGQQEADVYVSYQFPAVLGASNPETRSYKTPMRGYLGPAKSISFGQDASFSHDFSHSDVIDGANLLADLLRSFACIDSSQQELRFIVSVRLYRPVVRDIEVGYATLGLARLASLITANASAKTRQRSFVRLPVTPQGQTHAAGWLTICLDFVGKLDQQKIRNLREKEEEISSHLRINVRRAFNLRTSARHLGLKISNSSVGFKTYCALKCSGSVSIKADCEVSERSFCPNFRTSRFELSFKHQRAEDLELQMLARDRHTGDMLLGTAHLGSNLLDILLRFRPRSNARFILPLCTEQPLTRSDLLLENVVGNVELDLSVPNFTGQPAAIPSWFQTETRSKISLYIDKIVWATLAADFLNCDEVFRCRLSIGDSYASPLSISIARPQSTTYNGQDVIITATCHDSIVLEHAVPCPPFGEIVDFLARCSAKIEVQFNGASHVATVPLFFLLSKQMTAGQYPLLNQETQDFYGASVLARVAVEPLSSASNPLKDRLLNAKNVKVNESECFVASLGVSRALHLPLHLLGREVYVEIGSVEPVKTHCVPSCDRPIWNFASEAFVPREYLVQGGLNFRVLTSSDDKNEDDTVVGYASVDLTSLSLGIGQVSGWYHLVDAFGHCMGQILVSVQPAEEVYQPPRPPSTSRLVPVVPEPRPQPKFTEVQTDFDFIPPKQSQFSSVSTSTGPAIDLTEMESLSRRIAQLLADPLPPRFQPELQDQGTLTTPREEPVLSRPSFCDFGTETSDINADVLAREFVEKSTQNSVSSKSSKSSSSSSSSSSTSSKTENSNTTSSSSSCPSIKIPVEISRSQGVESPDHVQLMSEIDQVLETVEHLSPRASPHPNYVSTTIDQLLFAGIDPYAPTFNPLAHRSGDFESEDDGCHHLTMSPSVSQVVNPPQPTIQEATECAENSTQSSSPPPLEHPSRAETEEWSQHTAVEDPVVESEFCADYQNMSQNDHPSADWSAILQHQFNSPHHSSSPVSLRPAQTQRDDDDDQEGPRSPANTPRFEDETLTQQEDSFAQPPKRRKSPPAWLTDANAKLSNALPSFFPHPDSLRSALERVRSQRVELNLSELTSSCHDTSSSARRRPPPPSFDVDEARRIASIFSSSTKNQ